MEIGAVSLILIISTLCIGFVINKITTVVDQSSLVLSSEPFRETTKYKKNITKLDTEKRSVSENLITFVLLTVEMILFTIVSSYSDNLNFDKPKMIALSVPCPTPV